jgi:hypothetical protein
VIRVMNKNGKTCPILLCDICEKQIDNLGMGAAIFPRSSTEGEITEVLHTHKKSCHDIAEKRIGGKSSAPWQELQDHFIWLMANSGKPATELAVRANSLGEVGAL